MQTIIFACVHNAGRSQMAAAFFNQLANPEQARAVSAGTEPGLRVHLEVLQVMQEVGIDLSEARPQKLTVQLAQDASLLITMGCGDKCPYVPGLRRDDWPLKDPKDLPMEDVRAIRDEIKSRVQTLLASEGLQAERNILWRVCRLASFVAIFILLLTAAPLLACMTGRTMNQEESACCRAMHGNCGDMVKMGCCKTEVRADQSPQLATADPSTDVHFTVIAWPAPLLPFIQTMPPSQLRSPDEHSPPGLLTAQTSVLRI